MGTGIAGAVNTGANKKKFLQLEAFFPRQQPLDKATILRVALSGLPRKKAFHNPG